MKPTRLIFLLTCILFTANITAQSLNQIVADSEALYQNYSSSLVFPKNSYLPDSLYYKLPTHKSINSFNIELNELESKQYKKDIGLVFKATANYNFRNAFEEFSGGYIRGRIRAEIEWNILKEGYSQNKIKSERKKNEINILKEEDLRLNKELWRRQFRVDYNFVLNKEIITLYSNFLKFENEYFDILNKMYFQKLIKREKLIEVSNQINVIKFQLELVKKENTVIKDSVSSQFKTLNKLPILKVELDSVALLKENNKLFYKEENIKLQHHPINDYNFSVYVNQNYTNSSTTHNIFPSIGLRFRAPIRFNHRREIIKTKIKILRAEEADFRIGKYNSILTQFQEYNEKIRDLKNQYKVWQVLEERSRIIKFLKLEIQDTESGLALLNLTEQKFKVLENIIQIKRKMYSNFSKIYEMNTEIDFYDFVSLYKFKDEKNRQIVTLTKSSKFSLEFQLKFLKTKKVHKICVLKDDIEVQTFLKERKINFVLTQFIKELSAEELINDNLQTIKN